MVTTLPACLRRRADSHDAGRPARGWRERACLLSMLCSRQPQVPGDASNFRISGCRWTPAQVSFSFYRSGWRRGRWSARIARGTRHRRWSEGQRWGSSCFVVVPAGTPSTRARAHPLTTCRSRLTSPSRRALAAAVQAEPARSGRNVPHAGLYVHSRSGAGVGGALCPAADGALARQEARQSGPPVAHGRVATRGRMSSC